LGAEGLSDCKLYAPHPIKVAILTACSPFSGEQCSKNYWIWPSRKFFICILVHHGRIWENSKKVFPVWIDFPLKLLT
jgi:hypothetical protein